MGAYTTDSAKNHGHKAEKLGSILEALHYNGFETPEITGANLSDFIVGEKPLNALKITAKLPEETLKFLTLDKRKAYKQKLNERAARVTEQLRASGIILTVSNGSTYVDINGISNSAQMTISSEQEDFKIRLELNSHDSNPITAHENTEWRLNRVRAIMDRVAMTASDDGAQLTQFEQNGKTSLSHAKERDFSAPSDASPFGVIKLIEDYFDALSGGRNLKPINLSNDNDQVSRLAQSIYNVSLEMAKAVAADNRKDNPDYTFDVRQEATTGITEKEVNYFAGIAARTLNVPEAYEI